jgi:small-conductance mechanosensitive channel
MAIRESIQQSILVILSLLLSSYLVLPLKIFAFFGSALLSVFILIYVLSESWVTSNANEWLLITENGKMVKAGVGLKTFKTISQTAVRFSNSIRKIEFSADQVTN